MGTKFQINANTVSSPRPQFSLDLPELSFSRATQASLDRWKSDLNDLLRHANNRFADIAWALRPGGEEEICAHKAIIYARASGQFQLKYLSAPSQARHSRLPTLPSNSSVYLDSTLRSTTPRSIRSHLRSPSPSASSLNPSTRQLAFLNGTDPSLFQSILEALYTANGLSEVFAFLFDDHLAGDSPEARTDKLRKDLLYMWRSKLYADCQIVLINQHDLDNPVENANCEQEAVFAAHRSILCSRSPYFASLLLDPYADSNNRVFTLASPPFTPASLHFSLGYLYCGTLDFSNRNFDLSTAMQIWRSAQYLGLDLLREEVESKISDMCHNFKDTCKSCISRIGRVYAFSVALDVASKRLEKAAQPFLVLHFGALWNKAIGELDYEAQTHLVDLVCLSIDPNTVVNAIQGSKRLKDRLSGERSDWADHLLSMLEPIDEQIGLVLQRKFPAVVTSKGFQDLLVGVGFSNDVLEQVLITMVNKLTDENAAETYQVLVGQVLLREDGLPMDARVIVEDAKAGVLKYIKSHWTIVRALNGFDPLENWALKEISDEIEVPLDDLLLSTSPPALRTKTGLQVKSITSKSSYREDVTSTISAATLRASVLSRKQTPATQRPSKHLINLNTSRTPFKSENASVRSPVSVTPTRIKTQTKLSNSLSSANSNALRPTENRVSSTDLPEQKTASSKIPTGFPSVTKIAPTPKPDVKSTAKTEKDPKTPKVGPSKLAGSGATVSHLSGTPKKAQDSRAVSPSQSLSSVTSKPTRLRTTSNAPKPRRPESKAVPISSTTKPPRSRTVTAGSTISTRSALSISTGQRKSVANRKPPAVRKIPSSVSMQSEASTVTISGCRSRANTHSQNSVSTTPIRKGPSSPASLSFTPKSDRLRTSSATARPDAAANKPTTVPVTTSKRPSSVASVRTSTRRGSSMPSSAALSPTSPTSIGAKSNKSIVRHSDLPPLPSSDPPSTSSSKNQKVSSSSTFILPPRGTRSRRPAQANRSSDSTEVLADLTVSSEVSDAPSHDSQGSTISNSTVRLSSATPSSHPSSPLAESPLLPPENIIVTPSSTTSINKLALESSLATNEQRSAVTKPPGTVLLIGIPCVVATITTLEDGLTQPVKFRAVVKYLGETFFGPGQWVGVEVAEKEDMINKEWNDGTVDGIRYFELGQESKESKSRLFRNLSTTPSGSGSNSASLTGDRSHLSDSHYLNPAMNGHGLHNPEDVGSVNSLRPSFVSKSSSTTRTILSNSNTDEERATRGLFVRPQEVIFVF